MKACEHLELLVEEPSMAAFLQQLLPPILGDEIGFGVHSFNGKPDLLRKLPGRLLGYSRWLPEDWKLLVLVDQDRDDCISLKQSLGRIAQQSGLRVRHGSRNTSWTISNRIVVEELESWFFGDWAAVVEAYPRVSPGTVRQARFREADRIVHPWEAFEKILQRRNYFPGGLEKITAARRIAKAMDPERNDSHSFQVFYRTLLAIREQNLTSSTGESTPRNGSRGRLEHEPGR